MAVAVGLALLGAPTARAAPVPGPCALAREEGATIQAHARALIRCAVDLWPVPGGAVRAICIARRESGLIPWASSQTGLYLGLYQHSAEAWPERFETWTVPEWQLKPTPLNGRSNAIVTIRMVNAEGWGPWAGPGC